MKKLVKELSALMTVRHPYLLLLMGVIIDGPNLGFIDEFIDNSTLFYALHKNEPIIVHRDSKPENILLDRAMNVKIC